MFDYATFLSTLSNHPGVYQMLGKEGDVLYVGKAKNLKKRVSSYFNRNSKDNKTFALVSQIHRVDVTITRSENEALLLECNLIKKFRPRYNILLRDDKSFPYIKITDDTEFPRVDFFRGTPKKNGLYFGPYPSAGAVRETIHLIQKMFQLRTCHDSYYSSRTRPCLHHQIGMCSGSCAGLIDSQEYKKNVDFAVLFLQGKNEEILKELNQQMEAASTALNFELAARLRNQITKIRQIQQKQYISTDATNDMDIIGLHFEHGQASVVLMIVRGGTVLGSRSYLPKVPAFSTEEEILVAFITQHYLGRNIQDIPKIIITPKEIPDKSAIESAMSDTAKKKVSIIHKVKEDRRKWQEMANATAKQSIAMHLVHKANLEEKFKSLALALNVTELPKRIECYDISHTMGEETVGLCVVFDHEGPVKADYRRYNIKDITPGDDTAAMKQVIMRRFIRLKEHPEKKPDIVLIDGGLPQLNSALSVFHALEMTDFLVIGVAKGTTRKAGFETLHFENKPPIHLAGDSLGLHLIQQVRDEAHRFAITGHRAKRDKKRKSSTLESISGIGAKRRRELLRYFGGIHALNRASLDEIAKVPGISLSLAQRIYEALHNVAL